MEKRTMERRVIETRITEDDVKLSIDIAEDAFNEVRKNHPELR